MKVLITGGAGYLGSILTHELLESGHDVTVYDTGYYGFEGLTDIKNRIKIIQKDIRQIVIDDFSDIDVVIHLAALSNDPSFDFLPQVNWSMNHKATVKIIDCCIEAGIEKFIFASTASVYGFDPIRLLNEESEINPQSAYGRSKLACEKYLIEKMNGTSFKPIILRMSTLMGASPRMRYDLVVNGMTMAAYFSGMINVVAGGENWRPLCNVLDAAGVYVQIVNENVFDDCRGEIFNIVHKNYRISELANYIRHCINMVDPEHFVELSVEYTGREGRSYQISGEKIKSRLGIVPPTGVLKTVQHLWECFKNGQEQDPFNVKNNNLKWMKCLIDAEDVMNKVGGILYLKE